MTTSVIEYNLQTCCLLLNSEGSNQWDTQGLNLGILLNDVFRSYFASTCWKTMLFSLLWQHEVSLNRRIRNTSTRNKELVRKMITIEGGQYYNIQYQKRTSYYSFWHNYKNSKCQKKYPVDCSREISVVQNLFINKVSFSVLNQLWIRTVNYLNIFERRCFGAVSALFNSENQFSQSAKIWAEQCCFRADYLNQHWFRVHYVWDTHFQKRTTLTVSEAKMIIAEFI